MNRTRNVKDVAQGDESAMSPEEWRKIELAAGQHNAEAWDELAKSLKKRHSFRGLISLARDGHRGAARCLLSVIYWQIADSNKTQWPNELRGFMLECLDRVLDDGVSMDKAFFMKKEKRAPSPSADKALRDSQIARAVRYRKLVDGMTHDAAIHAVAETWKPFPAETGCVGAESVKKAYARYFLGKPNKKSLP